MKSLKIISEKLLSKSKKKLFELLPKIAHEINSKFNQYDDLPEKGLNHKFINHETYEKKSFIYIETPRNKAFKEKMIKGLEKSGFKVNRDYLPKGWFIEVRA